MPESKGWSQQPLPFPFLAHFFPPEVIFTLWCLPSGTNTRASLQQTPATSTPIYFSFRHTHTHSISWQPLSTSRRKYLDFNFPAAILAFCHFQDETILQVLRLKGRTCGVKTNKNRTMIVTKPSLTVHKKKGPEFKCILHYVLLHPIEQWLTRKCNGLDCWIEVWISLKYAT